MTPMTARATVEGILAGRRSAVDSAREALDRADAYDKVQPQAWIARVGAAEVLEQARRVDERLRSGERPALAGVPYAVKDNFDVAGMATTVGCPSFAYRPAESATVVQRLEQAGAILLGKTNLDQFATGLVGTRSPYGIPACVFHRDYVSGGSSSGSAVVVAAGITCFALGSDTAGSGRVPAAFNGLLGYKPTRGRWSTRGLFPACRSIDCPSVFAWNLEDVRHVDAVLAAFDDADPYSRPVPGGQADAPAQLRAGVARPGQLRFLGDAQSAALFDAFVGRVAASGARLVEVDIEPLLEAAQLLYAGPWVAERLAAISPFLQQQPAAVHPVVRAIIQGGVAFDAADAFRGAHALQERLRVAERMWRHIDLLVLPTAPTIYRISEVLAEPVALNSNLGLYTNFVNLLDMSAISLPAGFRDNGTGFGASLIGPAWAEERLFELARRLEAQPGSTPRPELDLGERVAARLRLAVAGAHLAGQPLHWQLASRGATLLRTARTAPRYRLYALTDQSPPKPALVHAGEGAAAIEVEIYELDAAAFGNFVAEVPAPLAIGKVELDDGSVVPGFVAEPRALAGALDITAAGGWRAYLAGRA